MNALQIAASGMSAQQMRVDVVSNNLANMSTTGYNARRADFADLMYQQVQRPGTISAQDGTMLPTGVQLGMGVRPSSVSVVLAQGSLSQTSGDLDVAIEGRGNRGAIAEIVENPGGEYPPPPMPINST